jgi:hypothetical protein
MGSVRHTCPHCGSTFDDEDSLAKHLEEHKDQPVQTE